MILLTATLVLASALPTTSSTPTPEPEQPTSLASFDPVALLAPAPVPVVGPSTFGYTYAEINYVYSDLDGVSGSQNGWDGTLSWNLLAGLYLQGTYASTDGSASTESYSIGAGYHISLGDKLDLLGLLSYEHDYIKVGGASGSGDGYELDLGGRFMLLEKLEINGQLEWNHVVDDNFGVQLGARYYLPGPLSVGMTVETLDNDFQFTAGVRFGF